MKPSDELWLDLTRLDLELSDRVWAGTLEPDEHGDWAEDLRELVLAVRGPATPDEVDREAATVQGMRATALGSGPARSRPPVLRTAAVAGAVMLGIATAAAATGIEPASILPRWGSWGGGPEPSLEHPEADRGRGPGGSTGQIDGADADHEDQAGCDRGGQDACDRRPDDATSPTQLAPTPPAPTGRGTEPAGGGIDGRTGPPPAVDSMRPGTAPAGGDAAGGAEPAPAEERSGQDPATGEPTPLSGGEPPAEGPGHSGSAPQPEPHGGPPADPGPGTHGTGAQGSPEPAPPAGQGHGPGAQAAPAGGSTAPGRRPNPPPADDQGAAAVAVEIDGGVVGDLLGVATG